jgi:hypothetical protein
MLALFFPFQSHTDASRELAEDFALALAKAGISQKEAALTIYGKPYSDPRLSRALRGSEGLNLWQVANLPTAFWVEFLKLRGYRVQCQVIEPGELSALIVWVRALVGMGKKSMAKALLLRDEREEGAA